MFRWGVPRGFRLTGEVFLRGLVMSSGQRIRVFYSFNTAEGLTLFHTCFLDCDDATTTLSLAGLSNILPTAASAGQRRHQFYIPIHSSGRSRSMRARTVTLKYTDGVPDGHAGKLVSVPVPVVQRFNLYRVGMTGTYRGLPVELITKVDGNPDVLGQIN